MVDGTRVYKNLNLSEDSPIGQAVREILDRGNELLRELQEYADNNCAPHDIKVNQYEVVGNEVVKVESRG